MHLEQLKDDYNRVEQAVAGDPELPEEYVLALHEIQRLMQPLVAEDASEWVSRKYRKAYKAKQKDERNKSLCRCSSRRCRLKNGKLPYQLRRRTSEFTPTQSPEEQLRAYLKRHPQALVIDEALDTLRDRKSEIARRLSVLEHATNAYTHENDPLKEWLLPADRREADAGEDTDQPTPRDKSSSTQTLQEAD